MALDFQQVRDQVKQLGENAPERERRLQALRMLAKKLLKDNALELERLRWKVRLVAENYAANLRCAVPVQEPLDAHFPLPSLPAQATLLAADGSQIAPDRHLEVQYCLVNLGAIQLQLGASETPATVVESQVLYGDQLYTPGGMITDASLSLMRDLRERSMLVGLADQAPEPVITFTDGPLELWGGREGEMVADFQKSQDEYQAALRHLCELHVTTAGYVDKPASNLVVRLLEVALTPEADLPEIKHSHPLRGVLDDDLFRPLLEAGERSAIFALQSQSTKFYTGALALHFFYLNVGRPGHPWLARVEIPDWVAGDAKILDHLQAVLVDQCQVMGNRRFPYLLHRAHETAVVSLEEKDQVTQMILLELRKRGVEPGELSQKQSSKELTGRTRYSGAGFKVKG